MHERSRLLRERCSLLSYHQYLAGDLPSGGVSLALPLRIKAGWSMVDDEKTGLLRLPCPSTPPTLSGWTSGVATAPTLSISAGLPLLAAPLQ
ncbi:hypothetical protein Taro_039473 [Colocasia esculenta]|uniref:Uncharacterized protein n=1 Tax=Colocasia esculenta TaxID=4460 RepID=A0A843WRM9_COLES|nr:hypothetical protein [Colocasia esculenta]